MSSGASLIAKSVQETAKSMAGKKRTHRETEGMMCLPSKKKVVIDFDELVKEDEEGESLLKKRN